MDGMDVGRTPLLTAWIGFLCFMWVSIMLLSPMACDGQAPGCQSQVAAIALFGAAALTFEVILLRRTRRDLWRAGSDEERRLTVLRSGYLLSLVPVVILVVLSVWFF